MIEIKLNNRVIEIAPMNFVFTCTGLLNQIIKTIIFKHIDFILRETTNIFH